MTEFVFSPSDDHLLLRELAHRVNNEFTSIINTISREAARSPNPEVTAALNEATEMLHNYVDVHRASKMPKPDTQMNAAESSPPLRCHAPIEPGADGDRSSA